MTDPIITEADRAAACRVMDATDSMALDLHHRIDVLALALAQARAEGRLAGMEEAAREADAEAEEYKADVKKMDAAGNTTGGTMSAASFMGCTAVAKRIRARARTTKEG